MSAVNYYMECARENKEIVYEGLTFYPLQVRDHTLHNAARPAFELLMTSLPPKLARMSWCPCLAEMDKRHNTHYTSFVLLVMAKALRLPEYSTGYRIYGIRKDDELKEIHIQDAQKLLTMTQMDEVRKIIALQNGYEIPDENSNPELVEAENYLAGLNSIKLKTDIEELVYSVAAGCGAEPEKIWDWPIRKMQKMCRAIDRRQQHLIYGFAEASGAKFRKGNPCPTWQYERNTELPSGFETLADIEAESKGLLPEAQKKE